MSLAAVEVADAAKLGDITAAFARLTAACAACHTLNGAPSVVNRRAGILDSGVSTTRHRRRDAAALSQMWYALVVRSDADWRKGSVALSTFSLQASDLPPARALPAALDDYARSTRSAADRARMESDSAGRVAVFGEILASCAGCHDDVLSPR
jgi:mono/diheme cytochrome c family protein